MKYVNLRFSYSVYRVIKLPGGKTRKNDKDSNTTHA